MPPLRYDPVAVSRRAVVLTKKGLLDRRTRVYREFVNEAHAFADFWGHYAATVYGFSVTGTYIQGIVVTIDPRGYPVVRNIAVNKFGVPIARFVEWGTGGPDNRIVAKRGAHAIPNKYGVQEKRGNNFVTPSFLFRRVHRGTPAMHVLREAKTAWKQIRRLT